MKLPMVVLAAIAWWGCGEKVPIPAHVTEAEIAAQQAAADPKRWLTNGERVFFDDFERAELGEAWVRDSVLELFQEDVSRFRVVLTME